MLDLLAKQNMLNSSGEYPPEGQRAGEARKCNWSVQTVSQRMGQSSKEVMEEKQPKPILTSLSHLEGPWTVSQKAQEWRSQNTNGVTFSSSRSLRRHNTKFSRES